MTLKVYPFLCAIQTKPAKKGKQNPQKKGNKTRKKRETKPAKKGKQNPQKKGKFEPFVHKLKNDMA
ncbi:MAG: hypothetical protein LBC43_00255 [Bifidobacteriaceae bacterium]|jgi:hypothetical protein|nr:hypothetical protein [Bifidobacteriaceae bacterium]